MKNGSILIISNDEQAGNLISEKVKLLRDCDNVQIVTYIETISILNSTQPSLMMVYSSNSDSISIVKEIRALKTLNKVPIILVMDYFIEDMLLYAFDNGIDDFFFMNDSDAVILMRIMLTIQKSILFKQIETTNDILVNTGIIDKQSGVYTKEHAPLAFKHLFSKSMEENQENSVFMCLKPVAFQNKRLNLTKIAETVKKIPRGNDIVAYGKNSTIYFILYNTDADGAQSVVERIQNALVNECNVFANAAEISASFEEMEPILIKSLKDQIAAGITFNFVYNVELKEAAEIMDIHDETGKNFKDFKKEFYNVFEKMVAPVFYQVQSDVADMIPGAKVNFDINEVKSNFTVSAGKVKSELFITYPSYMKLLTDIKHTAGSKRPQIRRLTFDFEDFSSERLLSMLKDMVNEFDIKLKSEKIENESESKPKAKQK